MKSLAAYRHLSIQFEREEIPVQTLSPMMVPDPGWKHIDKKGHGHFWKGKDLPTLQWVVTGKQWVGDEYGGDEYDVGEYRCRLCSEEIKPGKKPSYPKPLLSLATYTITIGGQHGETFVLSTSQYHEALEKWIPILRKVKNASLA